MRRPREAQPPGAARHRWLGARGVGPGGPDHRDAGAEGAAGRGRVRVGERTGPVRGRCGVGAGSVRGRGADGVSLGARAGPGSRQHAAMADGGAPLLPDSLLYHIFLSLGPADVLAAGLVCRQWRAVARDEFLWREQFYRYFQVARDVPRHPGARPAGGGRAGRAGRPSDPACAQRPRRGTTSSGGSTTRCPAWKCRRSRRTRTRSCTSASRTPEAASRPAPRTAR